MRLMTCTLPEGGDVIVHAGEYRRAIVGGDTVDFDQVLVPATDERPAFTLEDALGHHTEEMFEPCADPDALPSEGLEPAEPTDSDAPAAADLE